MKTKRLKKWDHASMLMQNISGFDDVEVSDMTNMVSETSAIHTARLSECTEAIENQFIARRHRLTMLERKIIVCSFSIGWYARKNYDKP